MILVRLASNLKKVTGPPEKILAPGPALSANTGQNLLIVGLVCSVLVGSVLIKMYMYRIEEATYGRTDRYSKFIGPDPPELGPRHGDTENNVTLSIHFALNRVWFESCI